MEPCCESSSQWLPPTHLLKEKGALAEVASLGEQRLTSSANCLLLFFPSAPLLILMFTFSSAIKMLKAVTRNDVIYPLI